MHPDAEALGRSLSDADRALLAQAFPGLALAQPAAAHGVVDGPEQAPLRLFEAVVRAFTVPPARAPRVLWIDDLQWADADSLRLLAYLGRSVASLPVLLVGALRPPALATGSPDRPDVRDLVGTAARRLPLGGLAREEIATLWRALRADAPAARALDLLLGRTAGNPFFLVHLLRQDDPCRPF